MKKEQTKRGKCPRCCPDGGAIFTDESRLEDHKFIPVWACNNCPQTIPRRTNKPTGKQSKAQATTVARLAGAGWVIEKQELVGRNLWVSATHPGRKWFEGDHLFGTIGVRGKVKITLIRVGGDAVVTGRIGMKVYLGA